MDPAFCSDFLPEPPPLGTKSEMYGSLDSLLAPSVSTVPHVQDDDDGLSVLSFPESTSTIGSTPTTTPHPLPNPKNSKGPTPSSLRNSSTPQSLAVSMSHSEQRVVMLEISAFMPRPIVSFLSWPLPRDVMLRRDQMFSLLMTEPPLWDPIMSPGVCAPLCALDMIMSQGLLVSEIHRYYRNLEFHGRRPFILFSPFKYLPVMKNFDHLGLKTPSFLKEVQFDEEKVFLTCAVRCASNVMFTSAASVIASFPMPVILPLDGDDPFLRACSSSSSGMPSLVSHLKTLFILASEALHHSFHLELVRKWVEESSHDRPPLSMVYLELSRQLSVVQNNLHPYYTPHSFSSSDGYKTWRQEEISRLQTLLRPEGLFQGLNASSNLRHDDFASCSEYFSFYKRLLRICLYSEKDIFKVSLQSAIILQEFGAQYGVGPLYRALVALEIYCMHVVRSPSCYECLAQLLHNIHHLIPPSGILAAHDAETLRSCINRLHDHVKEILSNVAEVFPCNKPEGTLSLLLDIFTSLQNIERRIGGNMTSRSNALLATRYLEEGFTRSYRRFSRTDERLKETESRFQASNALDPSPSIPSADVLTNTIELMCGHLETLRIYFQHSFEGLVNLLRVAAQCYYDQFVADLCLFMSAYTEREGGIDLSVFRLAHQLGFMWSIFRSHMDSSAIEAWRVELLPVFQQWATVISAQTKSWIEQSLRGESWRPVRIPHVAGNKFTVFEGASVLTVTSSFLDLSYAISQMLGLYETMVDMLYGTTTASLGLIPAYSANPEVLCAELSVEVRKKMVLVLYHMQLAVDDVLYLYISTVAELDYATVPVDVLQKLQSKFISKLSLSLQSECHPFLTFLYDDTGTGPASSLSSRTSPALFPHSSSSYHRGSHRMSSSSVSQRLEGVFDDDDCDEIDVEDQELALAHRTHSHKQSYPGAAPRHLVPSHGSQFESRPPSHVLSDGQRRPTPQSSRGLASVREGQGASRDDREGFVYIRPAAPIIEKPHSFSPPRSVSVISNASTVSSVFETKVSPFSQRLGILQEEKEARRSKRMSGGIVSEQERNEMLAFGLSDMSDLTEADSGSLATPTFDSFVEIVTRETCLRLNNLHACLTLIEDASLFVDECFTSLFNIDPSDPSLAGSTGVRASPHPSRNRRSPQASRLAQSLSRYYLTSSSYYVPASHTYLSSLLQCQSEIAVYRLERVVKPSIIRIVRACSASRVSRLSRFGLETLIHPISKYLSQKIDDIDLLVVRPLLLSILKGIWMMVLSCFEASFDPENKETVSAQCAKTATCLLREMERQFSEHVQQYEIDFSIMELSRPYYFFFQLFSLSSAQLIQLYHYVAFLECANSSPLPSSPNTANSGHMLALRSFVELIPVSIGAHVPLKGSEEALLGDDILVVDSEKSPPPSLLSTPYRSPSPTLIHQAPPPLVPPFPPPPFPPPPPPPPLLEHVAVPDHGSNSIHLSTSTFENDDDLQTVLSSLPNVSVPPPPSVLPRAAHLPPLSIHEKSKADWSPSVSVVSSSNTSPLLSRKNMKHPHPNPLTSPSSPSKSTAFHCPRCPLRAALDEADPGYLSSPNDLASPCNCPFCIPRVISLSSMHNPPLDISKVNLIKFLESSAFSLSQKLTPRCVYHVVLSGLFLAVDRLRLWLMNDYVIKDHGIIFTDEATFTGKDFIDWCVRNMAGPSASSAWRNLTISPSEFKPLGLCLEGKKVVSVVRHSLADLHGVCEGDLVHTINGTDVSSMSARDIKYALRQRRVLQLVVGSPQTTASSTPTFSRSSFQALGSMLLLHNHVVGVGRFSKTKDQMEDSSTLYRFRIDEKEEEEVMYAPSSTLDIVEVDCNVASLSRALEEMILLLRGRGGPSEPETRRFVQEIDTLHAYTIHQP